LAFWLKRAGEAVKVRAKSSSMRNGTSASGPNIRDAQQDSIEGYRRLIACAEQQLQAAQAATTEADEELAQWRPPHCRR
jgi:hypothetical protein